MNKPPSSRQGLTPSWEYLGMHGAVPLRPITIPLCPITYDSPSTQPIVSLTLKERIPHSHPHVSYSLDTRLVLQLPADIQ